MIAATSSSKNKRKGNISKLFKGRGVLFRMVLGQGLIGLLLLTAIAVGVWQLNNYNNARRVWEVTLERLSLIANARQDSTVLVLVTHRVVYTQAPFRYLAPESIRLTTDSIAVSAAVLEVSRNNLLEDAVLNSDNDPVKRRLDQASEYMTELIDIANRTIDYCIADEWELAQSYISSPADNSTVSEFEKIFTDLLGELRLAQILTQQEFVKAQEQMNIAGRTSIIVSAGVAFSVIVLGVVLSITIIRNITEPITQLSKIASQLAEGKFDKRILVKREDEFGHLAQVFNSMAAELQEMYASIEERAGTAEARLLQAIEGIPQGFVLFDRDDRIILCNEKYRQMLPEIADLIKPGVRYEDLIHAGVNRGIFSDSADQPNKWISERLEHHRNPMGSFEQRLSNGHWIQFSEYKTQDGGILVIQTDVTTRKFAEEELRLAKETAEEATEEKSRFLASASHELRTPLTSILGFAKIIQKRLDKFIFPQINTKNKKITDEMEQIKKIGNIIQSEGVRLTNLINDVLDLEKIEAGRFEWNLEPVSITSIIETATTNLSTMFLEKDLQLLIDLENDLPMVQGDRDALYQVMVNLISNAYKFTEKGSVTCKACKKNSEIHVSVIDTGVGISEEDQSKIFDKFTQASHQLTNKPKGTGLGLFISKQIIEHHGGRIWLKSEIGNGSNFSFSLPIPHNENIK